MSVKFLLEIFEMTPTELRRLAEIYDSGATMQEVADAIGVSRQRVHQLLSVLRPKKTKRIRKHHKRKAVTV